MITLSVIALSGFHCRSMVNIQSNLFCVFMVHKRYYIKNKNAIQIKIGHQSIRVSDHNQEQKNKGHNLKSWKSI